MHQKADPSFRHDWTIDEIIALYDLPLLELIARANRIHREFHDVNDVQKASLLSIKTGGCPEDCGYCSQSAHHGEVQLDRIDMMKSEAVLALAARAKAAGADRFCMGAAWRSVRDGAAFDSVLDMVRGVRALGMEACVTLGMLTESQAARLKEAGLTAYNHNLDTSREFYPNIVTTRSYDDRLATLNAVRAAGIEMCCGGIIGMGESVADRAAMLQTLAGFNPHPESVPINALVPIAGTPLAQNARVEPLDFVRMIAVARIVLPAARVRLSAGRSVLNREAQILCLVAGANSIFYGEALLTTPNASASEDDALFAALAPQSNAETAPHLE
ncbi:biotin synthase BioB [Methylocapsa acidiphila]|uniref:biotin synthase BioB n=1 Tax=Methylocapsa acidiphila TaxID=133552 RepID=UPI000425E8E5|nr:biotin synthase BioB [Methylocapsa acidiphila]